MQATFPQERTLLDERLIPTFFPAGLRGMIKSREGMRNCVLSLFFTVGTIGENGKNERF